MVTNKENLFKLGKKITDRIPYKLGIKQLDEECPEFWGWQNVLTDEMVEVALKMKKRTPTSLAEMVKLTGLESLRLSGHDQHFLQNGHKPVPQLHGLQKNLEPAILKNFAKYAVIEDPTIAQSVWRQMILGQHHGLPTRLLDWTQSALVALHFAVSEENLENMEDHDCMVWRIDISELHARLPEAYQQVMEQYQAEVFSVDMLGRAAESLAQYDRDMGDRAMVVLEPPSINSRIVNQYSFFSVIPMEMDNLEDFLDRNTEHTYKYVIDRQLRWRVRDMLDQLNMSERIVYPGLDGLSKWIARHYFVKVEKQKTLE